MKKVIRKLSPTTQTKSQKPPEILDRIKPVSSLKIGLSAVLHGRQGSGKTTLFGTFPTPSLLIDIRERGSDSVSNVKGMDVIQIREWPEFEQLYWALIEEGKGKYRSIGLDTVTQLQGVAMAEIRRREKKPPDFTSRRIFGQAAGLMNQWILNYRDLIEDGTNVCFICQERINNASEEDESDSALTPSIGPAMMPSIASTLNGAVSVIGSCFIQEHVRRIKGKKPERIPEYAMRVGPHEYYVTKIRSPKEREVPAIIIDPTFDKVVQTMRGK